MIEALAHLARGFQEAWLHLYDRVPSTTYDRERVSGTPGQQVPRADRVVVELYLDAQRNLAAAHAEAKRQGAAASWPGPARPGRVVHPEMLRQATLTLAANLRHLHDDTTVRQQILKAEDTLLPFWTGRREGKRGKPRLCLHCAENPPEDGWKGQRKWCSRCRKAHQPSRGQGINCKVCGLAQSA